jgi:hypothetical protein
MWERRGACRVLVQKPEEQRLLGTLRCRREDNIKMGLQEVGWGAWTGLICIRIGKVAVCCEYGNEPSGSIKCGEFLD